MSLTNIADFQFPLDERFDGRLFTRRKDLTNNIRLLIGTNGLHAILNGTWGTITHLADKYGISRTFIYSLANSLKKVGQFLFEETTATTPASFIENMPLSRCCRSDWRAVAVSAQSQPWWIDLIVVVLYGFYQSNTITDRRLITNDSLHRNGIIRYLVFTSDEIFSKSVPILITVDPCSSVILRMELATAETLTIGTTILSALRVME